MEMNSSEAAPSAEYGVAWRLLATLEVVTAVLVVLALLVHALRRRVLESPVRTQINLKGSVALITSDTPFSRELCREFQQRGCIVARLVPPGTLPTPSTPTSKPAPSTITFECTFSTKTDAHALANEVRARLGQPIDVLVLVNDDDQPSGDGLDKMDELVNKQLMRTCYLLESLVPLVRAGGCVLSATQEGGSDATHFARARRSFAELLHTIIQQIADDRGDIGVTSARLRGGAELDGADGAAGLAVRALCAGARDITIPTARQHYTFRIKDAVQKTQRSIYEAIWRRRKNMA